MVLALPSKVIFDILGYDFKKWLLVKKELDRTMWRVLSDLEAGQTKNPQRKTQKKLKDLVQAKFPIPDIIEQLEEIQGGSDWEKVVAAFNLGRVKSGESPLATLAWEVSRLERLAENARGAITRGEYQIAFEEIAGSGMSTLPCMQWVMGQIDCHGSKESFFATISPVFIVTSLYLLACVEADIFSGPGRYFEKLLPDIRGDKLMRPMTRWLDMAMEEKQLPTLRALRECLLTGDESNTQPVFNKWYHNGKTPAWSRLPEMVKSLSDKFGPDKQEAIKTEVAFGLALVRILDGLLELSLFFSQKVLPGYDPLAPFRDYPEMLDRARTVKAGLLTQ